MNEEDGGPEEDLAPISEPAPSEAQATSRFAPIPLLSGDVYEDEDHNQHRIVEVHVVITCDDGTTHTVPLTERFGGWWPPPQD